MPDQAESEITLDQWRAALNTSAHQSPPPHAKSVIELAAMLGTGERALQRKINQLKREGKVKSYLKLGINAAGYPYYVPVYVLQP